MNVYFTYFPYISWKLAFIVAVSVIGLNGCDKPKSNAAIAENWYPTYPLEYVLDLNSNDPIISYAWDNGSEIPFVASNNPTKIEYGEAGFHPNSILYMTFNEGVGKNISSLSHSNIHVIGKKFNWVEGRFGSALAFSSKESSLTIQSPKDHLLSPPWTLEFWVKVPKATNGSTSHLLTIPGVLSSQIEPSGKVVLNMEGASDLRLHIDDAWVFNEWNHLGIVYDGIELNQMRLIVNDHAIGGMVLNDSVGKDQGVVIIGDPAESNKGFIGAIDDLQLINYAKPTSEVVARYFPGASVGEHVLTLNRSSGKTQVKQWAGAIEKAVLEDSSDWTQGMLQNVDVESAGGLRWSPASWKKIPVASSPRPRTTHPTVYIGEDRVLIFGGETRDSHLKPQVNTNDTWYYWVSERRWERVNSKLAPAPRCHMPAAFSLDHNVVLLAGGYRNDRFAKDHPDSVNERLYYNDTWLFHPDKGEWERKNPSGDKLPEISIDMGLVYHPGVRKFVLFHEIGPTIFLYSVEENTWEKLPQPTVISVSGDASNYWPGASPMTGYDPTSNLILVFGGQRRGPGLDEEIFHNDTATYDVESNTFILRSPARAPSPRVRSGFAYDLEYEQFVLFGGVQDQWSVRNDDLWTYDMDVHNWQQLESAVMPTRRGGYYGMAYDPDQDMNILLAGRHAPQRFLNEAWTLSLDNNAVGKAIYVFDKKKYVNKNTLLADWQGDIEDLRLSLWKSADGTNWYQIREPNNDGIVDYRYLRVEVEMDAQCRVKPCKLTQLGLYNANDLKSLSSDNNSQRLTYELQ